MKFENTEAWNFKGAIRGMRNPKDSWDRSDTIYKENGEVVIGPNDLKLMQTLINAGSEHRKFMRQMFVSVDIIGGLHWWKEFDTYKVGVTSNSSSTMHKLTAYPITRANFEMDDMVNDLANPYNTGETAGSFFDQTIDYLENLRQAYLATKDKRYWKELIRVLPESWLQRRSVTMNYENLYRIVRQRRGHKLTEWKSFIDWAHTLPYANELIFYNYDKEDKNNG